MSFSSPIWRIMDQDFVFCFNIYLFSIIYCRAANMCHTKQLLIPHFLFSTWTRLKQNKTGSAANIAFCCFVFLDIKSGDGRTDGWTYGQHVWKQWYLPVVTLGWLSGSNWIEIENAHPGPQIGSLKSCDIARICHFSLRGMDWLQKCCFKNLLLA